MTSEFIQPDKGWERLVFDLCDKKMDVVIHLINKSINGNILKVQSSVVVFEETTDRYRKNVTYIPLHQIISISAHFQ